MPVPRAVIAIAGGTGSGKTSIANRIAAEFPHHVTLLPHDAYYKDNRHLTYEERARLNYDHPDAFDNELFIHHLHELRAGLPIERPVYNFATHLREDRTVRIEPSHIIVVEGVMVLEDPRMREMYDLMVYVDTDADVRILRRIIRDINERGRTLDSVIHQYLTTVKPMHEAFVEPTKRYANVIIPEGAHNEAGLEVLLSQIRHLIGQHAPSL